MEVFQDGFGAGADMELFIDVMEMGANSVDADRGSRGDLLV